MGELERLREKRIKQILEAKKMTKTIEVNDENFSQTISQNDLALIDCWAPWCAPCRMIAPVLDEIAAENSGKLTVGKLNVDENTVIPGQYGIMSIPTLLIFKGGELVDKITGAVPKQMIESKLKPHME